MAIHTLGDSHSYSGWSNIINHHIGPMLCYTFGQKKLGVCDIRRCNIQNGDTIVFCFGEIDCRCHIHKHITTDITYQHIIDDIISNYIEGITDIITTSQLQLKNVCIYNVVPPVKQYNTRENPAFPFLGSDNERKSYVLYFNQQLKQRCIENKFIFFDIYDRYIDENGFLKKELSDNNVHIKNGKYIQEFIEKYL